jgi:hypothetical protein
MKVSLRPYQDQGVAEIRLRYMQGRKSVLFVLPTGGGKTVVFSYITELASKLGNRICILVHRDELVEQTSRSLDAIGVSHGIIAAGRSMDLSCSVQVASVWTLSRRLHRIPASFFQLLIVDEAHHAVAGSWAKVIAHYANARVLGVTATPERFDGKGLLGYFDDMVIGPDAAWLTANGFLAPAKVFAPPSKVDTSKLRTRMGDFRMDDAERALQQGGIMGDAVTHYRRHLQGGTAIAFCCSVAHAEAVAKAFNDQGIRARSVDGTMDKAERRRLIEALGTGDVQVLTSCMIISEGTDVPSVSGAILLRPTQSLSLYLQMVGRCLRPAPGKAAAIILDHVGNSLRHGLPTDPRKWSLQGKLKQQRDAAPSVKTCPGCFAAIPSASRTCPECDHVFEAEGRDYITIDGDLVERTFKAGEVVEWLHGGHWQGGWTVQGVAASNLATSVVIERPARGNLEVQIVAPHQLRYPLRRQQAGAQTLEDLIAIGHQRGMKNPYGWARHVMAARQAKGQWRHLA